jgi:hypothetical protein
MAISRVLALAYDPVIGGLILLLSVMVIMKNNKEAFGTNEGSPGGARSAAPTTTTMVIGGGGGSPDEGSGVDSLPKPSGVNSALTSNLAASDAAPSQSASDGGQKNIPRSNPNSSGFSGAVITEQPLSYLASPVLSPSHSGFVTEKNLELAQTNIVDPDAADTVYNPSGADYRAQGDMPGLGVHRIPVDLL